MGCPKRLAGRPGRHLHDDAPIARITPSGITTADGSSTYLSAYRLTASAVAIVLATSAVPGMAQAEADVTTTNAANTSDESTIGKIVCFYGR